MLVAESLCDLNGILSESFNIFKKTEMTIVMVITIIAWVVLYYYYR